MGKLAVCQQEDETLKSMLEAFSNFTFNYL